MSPDTYEIDLIEALVSFAIGIAYLVFEIRRGLKRLSA